MYAPASNALSAKAAAASRRSPAGDRRASSGTVAEALFAFRASVPGKKRSRFCRAIVASASRGTPRGSKYDMAPVDFTATQKSAFSFGDGSKKETTRRVPQRQHLTLYGDDSATWDEGDATVTLLSWRDAKERLRFVNASLDAFIADATQECAVEHDGEMCGVAVDKTMRLLLHAKSEKEAVETLRALLFAGGPNAAEACEAWCWAQAGTEHEPRARAFAHVAARAFEHDTEHGTTSGLFLNNTVSAYLRDVREECPVFHGADPTCADAVDAALLMTVCSYVDVAEATRVVDAIVDAGEEAAIRAVQAWCVANPGAKHVDVIAERVAAAKTRGAA
jgi:hypothetical protein